MKHLAPEGVYACHCGVLEGAFCLNEKAMPKDLIGTAALNSNMHILPSGTLRFLFSYKFLKKCIIKYISDNTELLLKYK